MHKFDFDKSSNEEIFVFILWLKYELKDIETISFEDIFEKIHSDIIIFFKRDIIMMGVLILYSWYLKYFDMIKI